MRENKIRLKRTLYARLFWFFLNTHKNLGEPLNIYLGETLASGLIPGQEPFRYYVYDQSLKIIS